MLLKWFRQSTLIGVRQDMRRACSFSDRIASTLILVSGTVYRRRCDSTLTVNSLSDYTENYSIVGS